MNDSSPFRNTGIVAGIWATGILFYFVFVTKSFADCAPSGPAPFCLAGTTIAPGLATALIEQPERPWLDNIRVGDTIAGWHVGLIDRHSVILTHEDQTVRLELRDQVLVTATVETPGVKRGSIKKINPLVARGERPETGEDSPPTAQ